MDVKIFFKSLHFPKGPMSQEVYGWNFMAVLAKDF